MRILLLTHYYEPEIGAPQRRWRSLVDGFTARGHEVAVIAPVSHYPHRRASDLGGPRQLPWEWSAGVRGEQVMRVPYAPLSGSMPGQMADQTLSSAAAAFAALRLRRARPDVIVSTTPGLPMPFAAAGIARMLGAPHVAEVRDAWPDLVADYRLVDSVTAGRLPRRLAEDAERRWIPGLFHSALRRADALVTTAESFSAQLRARGMRRVETIRNTAETAGPAPVVRVRAAGEPLRLLYVGTVGRSQGLETAIRAVSRVSGVLLRVVGAGAQWTELRALAGQLTDRIGFRPQTTGPALEEHWDWADSGLVSLADVPSFERTVPSKLVNLMARGLHVTGVCAGEAAEIIRGAHGGHVSAPGDEDGLAGLLVRLRDDPRSTAVDGRPRQWLREHASPQRAVEDYLTLLEEVRA
ncbi:glycosyltransferase family 4 protein [Brevibacterium album]|uniref:glycosyltransferase family 4 protein n=1 Tax=Brevibacterium album TaxID=417948 RepID=UPI00042982E0|nr:glycosyltransferase family 4 protein [Brevibacterium album]